MSVGWDYFPALVAKQSIDNYIEPLTCLINRSFADGIFPNHRFINICWIFLTIMSFIGTNLAFEKSIPHNKQSFHWSKK